MITQRRDHCHGVCSRLQHRTAIIESDTADRNQWLLRGSASAFYPLQPDHRIRLLLGAGGKHWTDGDIVRIGSVSLPYLIKIVSRDTNDLRHWAEYAYG